MVSIDGLTVSFSERALFDNISFVINENDKIALMGKNGAGKSTLMKIIAGVQKPSKGKINKSENTTIAYLPQHLLTEDHCSVAEEAAKAYHEYFELKGKLDQLNNEMAERTDYESDSYMALIEQASDIGERFYNLEEVNHEAEVEKALMGLGFKRADLDRPTSEFSGGWRMRIELAKILLQKQQLYVFPWL